MFLCRDVLKFFIFTSQVEQDFVLMFGDDVSCRFLDKWTNSFKRKIIQQCRKLPASRELEELLLAAEAAEGCEDLGNCSFITVIMSASLSTGSGPVHAHINAVHRVGQ